MHMGFFETRTTSLRAPNGVASIHVEWSVHPMLTKEATEPQYGVPELLGRRSSLKKKNRAVLRCGEDAESIFGS